MSQKKISELTSTSTLTDYDKFPLVQDGVTKHILYSDMKKEMVEDVHREVSTKLDEYYNEAMSAIDSISDYKYGSRKIGEWGDGKTIKRLVCTSDEVKSAAAVVNSQAMYGLEIKSSVGSKTTMGIVLSCKVHFKNATNLAEMSWSLLSNNKWCFHYLIFNPNIIKPSDIDTLIVEYVDFGE